MGDTMYLLQIRRVKSAASVEFDVERWKMGAADPDAQKAATDQYTGMDAQKLGRPRAIIAAIAKAWTTLTAVPVKHVRPYIVFSLNQCARDAAGKLASAGEAQIPLGDGGVGATLHKARAVSVEDIEFFRFSRDYIVPVLTESVPPVTTMEEVPTPPFASAGSAGAETQQPSDWRAKTRQRDEKAGEQKAQKGARTE